MTKPFDHNDYDAIRDALDDPHRDKNKIAQAMTVRLEALLDVLKSAVNKRGEMPREIELTKPKTALDRIAIEMFQKILREEGVGVAESLNLDPSDLSWVPTIRIIELEEQ